MLKKLSIYLLIFATTFNVAGGYAIAASFKAASFSVCQLSPEPLSPEKTTIKQTASDLVILVSPLIKEGEDKSQKFDLDFPLLLTPVPYFLPLLRAGPLALSNPPVSPSQVLQAPLFLLFCNFRV